MKKNRRELRESRYSEEAAVVRRREEREGEVCGGSSTS